MGSRFSFQNQILYMLHKQLLVVSLFTQTQCVCVNIFPHIENNDNVIGDKLNKRW